MTFASSAPDTPLVAEGPERTCRVTLEIFDGPLDLLLHLVRERELDVATVPLALVAQQYLDYVSLMEALELEVAAEYLVVAATLVFLKSKALLPPIPSEFVGDDESAEEVEARLRRRLISYSKYRDVAQNLQASAQEAAAFFYRDAGDPGTELVQHYRIEPGRLGSALLAALRNAKPEKRTIARERVSLIAQMEVVMRAIRASGDFDFVEFCAEYDRPTIIVTFLAILELIRQGRLDFDQNAPDGSLRLFERKDDIRAAS